MFSLDLGLAEHTKSKPRKRLLTLKEDFGPFFITDRVKDRVHSKMKIFDKIKFSSNIVLFAFIFSKNVSFSSNIHSRRKISLLHFHLQGPAISSLRTCIFTSEDLHFHLWDLHYHFQDLHYCVWTCIFTSGTCIIAPGPTLFYRNSSVQKIKEPLGFFYGSPFSFD